MNDRWIAIVFATVAAVTVIAGLLVVAPTLAQSPAPRVQAPPIETTAPRPWAPPPAAPMEPVTPVAQGQGVIPSTSLALEATRENVPVYDSPTSASSSQILPAQNVVGQPQGFLVMNRQPGWYEAQLPVHPTRTGWIPATHVREKVVDDYILIKLSEARLDHFEQGVLKQSFAVAVGKPSTPTPTGKFYVMGYINDPIPMYEPVDVGLSAFSPVLKNWRDNGRSGIHGWGDSSVMGKAASNGCIRMRRQDAALLEPYVEVGVPVEIIP